MEETVYNKYELFLTRFILILFLVAFKFSIRASTPEVKDAVSNNSAYQEYIGTHYKTAIRQQKEHKIPASIILAQGLLESAAGQSYLALAANNHFGLKCTDWRGLCIYKNDDGVYSCFRKYLEVSDSFEDHSRFLIARPHYKPLFKLKVTDYKGWAQGLKRYGYASDPNYATKLIKLIESYQLYYYDTAKETDPPMKVVSTATKTSSATQKKAQPVKKNTTKGKTSASSKK
ncbi:MAG: glucosaminidase domain-containing protein [Tannerella sp.]|jgi:flagellum-specific peptidoglycan hydrolase FlgJ|nr:glucosaminidase domain-containing protein [Tannerella sp.]